MMLLVVVLILGGCSGENEKNHTLEKVDGVDVYKNTTRRPRGKPAPDITPKLLFKIKGTDPTVSDPSREIVWPRFMDTDRFGNIYILDTGTTSVKKFEPSGKFITAFGSRGSGPGEMQVPFMIGIIMDTVYVIDPQVQRMVTFGLEGKFLETIRLLKGIPNFMQRVGQDKFAAFMLQPEQSDAGAFLNFNLNLLDLDFQPVALLKKYRDKVGPLDVTILDRFTAYAVGKDKIFVAENSGEIYKINAFDFSGKLLYAIEKEYSPIYYSTGELEELNTTLKFLFKKMGRQDFVPVVNRHKKSITSMYCDVHGRLLVRASVERDQSNRYDFLVDVFEEGVFQGTVKLEGLKGYDFLKLQDEKIFFKDNRIFYLDEPGAELSVFQY